MEAEVSYQRRSEKALEGGNAYVSVLRDVLWMDKAEGESTPGREVACAKAQACQPYGTFQELSLVVRFCSLGRMCTVGREKSGGNAK